MIGFFYASYFQMWTGTTHISDKCFLPANNKVNRGFKKGPGMLQMRIISFEASTRKQ